MNEQLWVSRETVSHLVDTLRTMPAQQRNESAGQTSDAHRAKENDYRATKGGTRGGRKIGGTCFIYKTRRQEIRSDGARLEIIAAIVDGQSNRDIALTYKISEYTVKHHLTRIFDKVGVFSRLELAMFAIHHDLVGHLRETSSQT